MNSQTNDIELFMGRVEERNSEIFDEMRLALEGRLSDMDVLVSEISKCTKRGFYKLAGEVAIDALKEAKVRKGDSEDYQNIFEKIKNYFESLIVVQREYNKKLLVESEFCPYDQGASEGAY
ncbi:MAG: hypothetical protein AABX03_01290 [Nanoarchaeota archaeon]